MNPSTPPKGSLEDLFRHHLLESEAASIPPRPQVWEQLDNSLLLAQNEHYRQRLRVHRWAIAASLLLASLAGGGWWHSQQRPAPTLATAAPAGQPATLPGLAAARRAAPAPGLAPAPAPVGGPSSIPTPSAIDQTPTLRALAQTSIADATTPGRAALPLTNRAAGRRAAAASPGAAASGPGQGLTAASSFPGVTDSAAAAQLAAAEVGVLAPVGAAGGGQRGFLPPAFGTALPTTTLAAELPAAQRTAGESLLSAAVPADNSSKITAQALAVNSLATHPASLDALGAAALPASLSPVEITMPPVESARRWQYGLSYAASVFQPNIDFTKAATSYNSALGVNSASITRSAAVEYRNNLRAGLGQRLGGWASRRLGSSRWHLRTGLELAQNTASSASSVAFVGEQVADLSYAQAMQAHLQRTTYRYRSAGAAAEVRYANPLKTGFSLYGRVGALFSALLNARSEVEGNPEATRTYTLLSTESPYRHLTTSLRGGGGLQYRPVGHQWALSLGPVAEFGIWSLNADPSQGFWQQQRPYSFGLEAGLELGRPFRVQ